MFVLFERTEDEHIVETNDHLRFVAVTIFIDNRIGDRFIFVYSREMVGFFG